MRPIAEKFATVFTPVHWKTTGARNFVANCSIISRGRVQEERKRLFSFKKIENIQARRFKIHHRNSILVLTRALPHVSLEFIDTIPTFGCVTFMTFEKIYAAKCRATAATNAHFGAPFARKLRTTTAYLDAPTIFDPAEKILTIWTYSMSGLHG